MVFFQARSFLPFFVASCLSIPYGQDASIRSELGPLLSAGAVIIDSNGGNLTEATQRWQQFASPNIQTVVQVDTEEDIVQTIKYANAHSIPFLAVNAGHGETKSLGRLQNGIQITIRKLNKITINSNTNTATIQGGASNLDVTTTLWNAKKQTVTGTCECVGFLGPLLGGGHGFLQGFNGLAADNLVEARVVLANGSIVTTSEKSNKDLFWALRGAGHNFGIVTEVTSKIYSVPDDDVWYYENFVYSGDSVTQLFTQLRTTRRSAGPEFQHYSVFLHLPDVDPNNAMVFFCILYHGSAADARQWVEPFRQLKPLSIVNGTAKYPELSTLTGNGINDDICQNENLNRIRYPVYLDRFDPAGPKAVFDLYNNMTTKYPALNRSLMLFEGLSSQAVNAVKLDTTAVPQRRYAVLTSPVITYVPDPSLDAIAQQFGRDIRSILQKSSEIEDTYAYVNYAVGEEPLESIYGYQPWRLDRLRKLKSKFDPTNRFQWYAPVVSSNYN